MRKTFVIRGVIVCALLVAFIWPAIYNRQPFFYPDTLTYVREGDAIGAKLTHHTSIWSPADHSASNTTDVTRARSISDAGKKGIMAGRSIFYGVFIYLGFLISHFWLTIVLQAALALAAAWLAMRAFGLGNWKSFLFIALGLLIVSDLPFVSSMVMPDIFAAFTILAGSVLFAVDKLPSRADTVAWSVLLGVSVLFHDTCLLLVIVYLCGGILFVLLRRSWHKLNRLSILAAAAALGFFGHFVFKEIVLKTTGSAPLHQPFVMARLQADGPGAKYLHDTCPGSGFIICAYANRMPMTSDTFLFNGPEDNGVLSAVPMDTRRQIEKEQTRFVIGVFRHDPVAATKTSLSNAFHQLVDFHLLEYSNPPGSLYHEGFSHNLPLPVLQTMEASKAYQGTFPVFAFSVVIYVFVVASLLYLLGAAIFGRRWDRAPGRLSRLNIAVLAGIVFNAAICGALSGIYPRFTSRVIWLVPLLALFSEAQCRLRRDRTEV